MSAFKHLSYSYVVLFLLGLILLVVSLGINYRQNDEYIHYRVVENFSNGNFVLDSYLGSTFVTQALLGVGFVKLFGLENLPVLTAILSFGCLLFLFLTSRRFLVDGITALVATLCLFVNPLFIYSSFGFMTEVYLLFFTVIALFFLYQYSRQNSGKYILFFNLATIAGFLVKQFAFIGLPASAIYLFVKKQYKAALLQFGLSAAVYAFYMYIFPRTEQMRLTTITFHKLQSFTTSFSLVFTVLMYLSLFTAPLIVYFALNTYWTKRKLLTFFVIAISMLVVSLEYFSPDIIGSGIFPYLRNTFGREGFYPTNLEGTKYAYPGFFDLFSALEITGRVLACTLVALLIVNIKSLLKFEAIYIILGVGFLLVTPKIFDRYLLVFIPPLILLLLGNRKAEPQSFIKTGSLLVFTIFIVFWLFFVYQFFSDFYYVNKYITDKALEITKFGNVERNLIKADHSWIQTYPNKERNWQYYFEYRKDSRKSDERYELVDTYKVSYPLNFYIDPYVYLYRRR